MERNSVMRNAINCWRVRKFNAIAATGTISPDADSADRTDSIFRNMDARVGFDTFIGFMLDSDQKTSVIWVARADTCMKFIIEDLQRRLKAVARGGPGNACTEIQIQRNTRCGHRKSASQASHVSLSHVKNGEREPSSRWNRDCKCTTPLTWKTYCRTTNAGTSSPYNILLCGSITWPYPPPWLHGIYLHISVG